MSVIPMSPVRASIGAARHAKILFLGTPEDEAFKYQLKGLTGTATVYMKFALVNTIAEVTIACKKAGITGILTTSKTLLRKLIEKNGGSLGGKREPSLDDYAGSYFIDSDIEFIFLNPLEHLVKVPYAPFLFKRYISKLTKPEEWYDATEFSWSIATPNNMQEIYDRFSKAYAIAYDIETEKADNVQAGTSPIRITEIGYTAIFIDANSNKPRTESVVFEINSMWAVTWMRKLNALPIPKITQNGKYDHSYSAYYSAPCSHWYWDTATQFHCWYAELPKTLGFLNAFFIRTGAYWKDLARSEDKKDQMKYNCLDHWATANVWMAWMLEAPEWAKQNYLMEMPINWPAHMCEMRGIKRDMEALTKANIAGNIKIESLAQRLEKITATPGINSNSPKQIKALLAVLGCKDLLSSDEKNLKKAATRHPLNSVILNTVLDIRKVRKSISTYLGVGKNDKGEPLNKEFGPPGKERILWSLNPHGTDTGRLASKEHHFWCGLQIQNVPGGDSVKSTLIADDGWLIFECDSEQAEARDVAYLSGDESLLAAVNSSNDFHSTNAAAFFGMAYAEIYDNERSKTLNKPIRDLSKRTNHGANYNMGPAVMLDTMGEENVWKAQTLLKLPKAWTGLEVCRYLLDVYAKTYPKVKGDWYRSIIATIKTTGMLTGSLGWTRFFFGKPDKNKLDLNAAVAHAPQSANGMRLNKAFMRVFWEIAMHPEKSKNFKLMAQIHDSIFGQVREGHHYLIEEVRQMMEVPIQITDCSGVTRTQIVPAAAKAGKDGRGAKRWSETE